MLKITLLKIKKLHTDESGIALAEAIVAAAIILLILVATAGGLTASFGATSSTQNRATATQLVNKQIAIAQQSPYVQLGVPAPSPTPDYTKVKCNPYTDASRTGEVKVVVASPPGYFPGLNYCETVKPNSNVGITYYVETQVTYVTNFDGNAVVNTTISPIRPKRVIVTVTWAESADSTGKEKYSSYTGSWISVPTIGECPPSNLVVTKPAGC